MDLSEERSTTPLERYDWTRLSRKQKNAFGRHFAMAEFAMHGFDVLVPQQRCGAVDFSVRRGKGPEQRVKVRSVTDDNYAFVLAKHFAVSERYFVALVRLLRWRCPVVHLFRGTDWSTSDGLLRYRAYEGLESLPEYGINLARKHDRELEEHVFSRVASTIRDA